MTITLSFDNHGFPLYFTSLVGIPTSVPFSADMTTERFAPNLSQQMSYDGWTHTCQSGVVSVTCRSRTKKQTACNKLTVKLIYSSGTRQRTILAQCLDQSDVVCLFVFLHNQSASRVEGKEPINDSFALIEIAGRSFLLQHSRAA